MRVAPTCCCDRQMPGLSTCLWKGEDGPSPGFCFPRSRVTAADGDNRYRGGSWACHSPHALELGQGVHGETRISIPSAFPWKSQGWTPGQAAPHPASLRSLGPPLVSLPSLWLQPAPLPFLVPPLRPLQDGTQNLGSWWLPQKTGREVLEGWLCVHANDLPF